VTIAYDHEETSETSIAQVAEHMIDHRTAGQGKERLRQIARNSLQTGAPAGGKNHRTRI